MKIQTIISTGIKNYANFSGRASRSEYWVFGLFILLVSISITSLSLAIPNAATAFGLLQLALIPPAFSICVRRLHDLDKSGWQYFIVMIPLLGTLMMFVWFCTKGTDGNNKYGEDPLALAHQ